MLFLNRDLPEMEDNDATTSSEWHEEVQAKETEAATEVSQDIESAAAPPA